MVDGIAWVRREQVPQVWPFVKGKIAAACRHSDGTWEAIDVLERCLVGEMRMMLIGSRAVAVAEVIQYPRSLTVRVPIIGGAGMTDWLQNSLAFVEAWAREIGADRIEGCGRVGWTRVLPGFHVAAYVVAKGVK